MLGVHASQSGEEGKNEKNGGNNRKVEDVDRKNPGAWGDSASVSFTVAEVDQENLDYG